MDVDDIIKLIVAIVAALGVLGAGVKWLVGWVVDRFLKGLDANTKAITEASAAHVAAINAQMVATATAAAAQVAALNANQMEVRELRVEVRTLLGMRRPTDEERSVDGEPPNLTPIRGVPESPNGLHLSVLRKGDAGRKP